MKYHVRIIQKQKGSEWMFDLSKDKLIEQIVNPYLALSNLSINGITVEFEEINRLEIRRTENPMKQIAYGIKRRKSAAKKLQEDAGVTGLSPVVVTYDEAFITGNDVLAEFISERPISKATEKRYKDALSKIENYKRIAYRPHIKNVERKHNSKSKIGGLPYLRTDTDWPECPNCKNNLQLFLQLNLNELPTNKSDGLVQLFYCTNPDPLCESDCRAFFPFSKVVACRKIELPGKSSIQIPKIEKLFEEKEIVKWSEEFDYPHSEEWNQLGINFEIDDDIYELMYERNEGVPLRGDKLFGWPFWVQSVEYPKDRINGNQMSLLFQFDSNVNLSHSFGDLGIGHLTISPKNPNELAFGWAC